MHFLLLYEVADDYLAKRVQFREEHLALARAAAARGELVLGGALAEPVDGAVLLFQGQDARAAEAFAAADPYVKNGLVTRYRVRPWTTVVGEHAAVSLPGDAPPAKDSITRGALASFLGGARHWTVSSSAADGAPQSAVVGVAVAGSLELVFDTLRSSRKAANIARSPRVSAVMWRGAATAQIEGLADEPSGAELERIRAVYLERFPDGVARMTPETTYVRIRPTWIRTTDFSSDPPSIVELDASSLAALGG